MELKELTSLVLIFVFVGMLLGVGVLVLDKYSRAARDTTTAIDANVNVSAGSATLSQTYCLSIAGINNAANASTYDVGTYTSFIDADVCSIASTLPVKGLYNVTYTYGVASAATTATSAVVTGISPIGTVWMSLLVTVAILSIILTLVIKSFAGKR